MTVPFNSILDSSIF